MTAITNEEIGVCVWILIIILILVAHYFQNLGGENAPIAPTCWRPCLPVMFFRVDLYRIVDTLVGVSDATCVRELGDEKLNHEKQAEQWLQKMNAGMEKLY